MAASAQARRRCRSALSRELRPELFRALADPTRLLLVGRLAASAEPLSVTDLQSCCGVHISGVSRQLALLRDADVVDAEREGREVRYRLRFDTVTGALRGLADALDACRKQCCGDER